MSEHVAHGMSLAEFIRRYDADGPFEIIDGEIIEMSPHSFGHTVIAKRIYHALFQFEERGYGEAYLENVFILTDQANWRRGSRIPNVMFVLAETLEGYEQGIADWNDKPMVRAPDLAVEVISATDSYSAMMNKVSAYLQDGVALVWVVDPD